MSLLNKHCIIRHWSALGMISSLKKQFVSLQQYLALSCMWFTQPYMSLQRNVGESTADALYIITDKTRRCSRPAVYNQPQWGCSHLTGSWEHMPISKLIEKAFSLRESLTLSLNEGIWECRERREGEVFFRGKMHDIWLGEIGALTTSASIPRQMRPQAMKERKRQRETPDCLRKSVAEKHREGKSEELFNWGSHRTECECVCMCTIFRISWLAHKPWTN